MLNLIALRIWIRRWDSKTSLHFDGLWSQSLWIKEDCSTQLNQDVSINEEMGVRVAPGTLGSSLATFSFPLIPSFSLLGTFGTNLCNKSPCGSTQVAPSINGAFEPPRDVSKSSPFFVLFFALGFGPRMRVTLRMGVIHPPHPLSSSVSCSPQNFFHPEAAIIRRTHCSRTMQFGLGVYSGTHRD
jgi:hypothetical protein